MQKIDFFQDVNTIFNSDLINNMNHMRISSTEHSSLILSQLKLFQKVESNAKKN